MCTTRTTCSTSWPTSCWADSIRDPKERLRLLAASLAAVLEEHPAAPFLLSRPFQSPAGLRVSEALLGILDGAGFDTGQSVRLLQVVTGMVLGAAIHRATYAAAWRDRPPGSVDDAPAWVGLESGEFPYLSGAAEQLMSWSPESDADRLTIDLLVSGLEALASQTARVSTVD